MTADNQEPSRPVARPRPSLLSANLLYLATMLLILTAGAWMQARSFSWGLLATELLLILLPTLLLLWRSGLPAPAVIRLRWPGWLPVAGAFLMGLGLWILDTWLGSVSAALLGYSQPAPAQSYPASAGQAVVLLVAFALAAPLAEEVMFRGYIQSAYERFGGRLAILVVALMFAVYHLTLVGLGPRVPIALALGYVVWRSGSLQPGIAMHLANNLLGGLALIYGSPWLGLQLLDVGVVTGWAPWLLLLLGLAGLWLFQRSTSAPADVREEGDRRLAYAWPLLLAGLVFGVVAGLEVVTNRFPALLAFEPAPLTAPWQEPVRWDYQLETVRGDVVGSASCALDLPAGTVELACTARNEPFEFRIDNSYWSSGAAVVTQTVRWAAEDMALLAAQQQTVTDNGSSTVEIAPSEGQLQVEVGGELAPEGSTTIAPDTLLEDAWPWRLAALDFAAGDLYRTSILYPLRWDPQLERNALTLTEETVRVVGTELMQLPAGEFMAWRVQLGDATAWYDSQAPHTLLRYDDRFLIWSLQARDE